MPQVRCQRQDHEGQVVVDMRCTQRCRCRAVERPSITRCEQQLIDQAMPLRMPVERMVRAASWSRRAGSRDQHRSATAVMRALFVGDR